jgi:hypothetical protein
MRRLFKYLDLVLPLAFIRKGVDGTDWIPWRFWGMRKGNGQSLQNSKSRYIKVIRIAFGGVLL